MNVEANRIICGDSAAILPTVPNDSINLIITSPPYFQQRNYGGGIGNEQNLDDYIANLIQIFKECVRVLRPDGSIVFNLGDKYQDSNLLLIPYVFALEAIKQPPVKLVNEITWVKANPTPRQFKRRLVSSTEPFFHFVKSDHYFYHLDAFLEEKREPKKNKNGSGEGLGKRYFELIETSELTPQQKQHARQELMKVIQEVKNGQIQGFRMKIRGIHAEPFGGQAGGRQIQLENNGFTIIRIYGNPIKRDVIETPVESLKGSGHPAIYPSRLIIEFLHLLTRENDLVLDPFMGSGSTAVACKLTNRRYLGIELNTDYCQLAESRLQEISPRLPLLFD